MRAREIDDALNVLAGAGLERQKVTLLHCTTEYPAPYRDVNLKAMCAIGGAFEVEVGYSCHTLGIEVPIAAVALGAKVIEKHFTLDTAMPGPDHRASLDPPALTAMVAAIRHIEAALGDGRKRLMPSEAANLDVARKSLVAAVHIRKGEVFSEDNLTAKRPGSGISPMRWESVIGRVAGRDYVIDEQIEI